MRWTSFLRRRQAAEATFSTAATPAQRNLKSLALSVYFRQPDFGMQDYEILSRASAFLLRVDGGSADNNSSSSSSSSTPAGPYDHLERAEQQRSERHYRQKHKRSQAAGSGRQIMDLGWLEFVPREVRPQVHVVASSHVLAPFLWRDYYPQDWLKHVRAEHCAYSVEVFDPNKPQEALAKIALNKEVFHHPEGRDIALVHFQEEPSSLKLLKRLGVQALNFRDPDKLYQKGEDMAFDGFVVSEQNVADSEDFQSNSSNTAGADEDTRIFYPYKEQGQLSFHTKDRFFATTPDPLPEGLCGAPVLDTDGDLCGTVEGIVPTTHKDTRLAGSAAFLPSYMLQAFVDYVERGLLEQMMPKDLFQMVVTAKKTNSIGGGSFTADADGNTTQPASWEDAYDVALENLKKRYSKEEVDAILSTIENEQKEVIDIMDKEGGDLDETIQRVRRKTLEIREMVQDQYRKQQQQEASTDNDDDAAQQDEEASKTTV